MDAAEIQAVVALEDDISGAIGGAGQEVSNPRRPLAERLGKLQLELLDVLHLRPGPNHLRRRRKR